MSDTTSAEFADDIAVLLGTYNGANHLPEQLASILGQGQSRLTLYVSDDGSTDGTLDLIAAFARAEQVRVAQMAGPRKGFAENYRSLILKAETTHDYYLFCDQDDIWHPNRIDQGIAAITNTGRTGPVVACGRTLSIDEAGRPLGLSPLFSRPPSLRNALVQSIAGGNTMTLNAQAFALLRQSVGQGRFVSHDWWTYIIVTAVGGEVVYLSEPTLSYRQHADNIVGANSGVTNRLQRLWRGFRGAYRDWNRTNLALLQSNLSLVNSENRDVIELFQRAQTARLPGRIVALRNSGVYRQSFLSDVNLYAACLLGKI